MVAGHTVFFGIFVKREVIASDAGIFRGSRVKVERGFPRAFQQELWHNPAREIGDDVIAVPVAGSIGKRVTPYAQAVGYFSKAILAKGQGAGTVGVIGFAKEKDGSINLRHENNYIPEASLGTGRCGMSQTKKTRATRRS